MTGTISINGSRVGTGLQAMLDADEIVPGSSPSYELCKIIYSYHPLGAKMVDSPIKAAQSQAREITVGSAPDDVRDAFVVEWLAIGADDKIKTLGSLARVYGVASLAVLNKGVKPTVPFDVAKSYNAEIAFNTLDPLNTAGSLVLNQDPNAIDFQKHTTIAVAGVPYARNRTVTLLNEQPLYIEYTASAFGYVGRSVYQRPLFLLKSFVQTMITDDMVSKKAGLIIAFIKGAGSVVDNLMAKFAGLKRSLLKIAVVENVLSMGTDDRVESLNLQNLDGAFGNSRSNIIKNIATSIDAPAALLENESLTEGFGEGTEDAKMIAGYIDGFRKWLAPAYAFFDPIVQRRAWNPDFFKIMQKRFPDEYEGRDYEEVFLEWRDAFVASWPSLIKEPDSELVKVEDVKFKALLATAEVLGPQLDPENKATLIDWVAANLNENKLLFAHPLEIDLDLLRAWKPEVEQGADGADGVAAVGVNEKLDSASGGRKALAYYEDAVKRLPLRIVGDRKTA